MVNKLAKQSNFQLLRIISMAMIVGLHYFNGSMGGALEALDDSHFNYYVAHYFESLFIVSVNCFILITGYFQINKTTIMLSRVIDLLVQMIFYGLVFYFIAVTAGWVQFSLIDMVLTAVPILRGLKWFIKVFIVLYLLIPFINLGLKQFDKKTYKTMLITMTLLFSVYPSFLTSPPVTDNGYGIITFVFLYAIGGYLRNFYSAEKSKRWYLGGYFIFGTLTFILSLIVGELLPGLLGRVWGYNFLFNIMGAVSLFLFFSKLDIKSTKINYIASFSLGVYFVHTEPLMYDFLYGTVLQTHKFWFSPWFIVHVFLSILFVYIISTIIDIVRKQLFDSIGKLVIPTFKKAFPVFWRQIPYISRGEPNFHEVKNQYNE